MIKLDKRTRQTLFKLRDSKRVYLEGNILKLIESDDDEEFQKYIDEAIKRDKEKQRKRLDITKKVQIQNNDLIKEKKENNRVNRQLTKALERADESKAKALNAKKEAEKSKEEAEIARQEAEHSKLEALQAKEEAENARVAAETDLELMQKKTQFELIGTIVKAALWIIVFVGVVVTSMYIVSLATGKDTTVISSTWTNIIGILLTNAFSIVGTIMGVKYATQKKSE